MSASWAVSGPGRWGTTALLAVSLLVFAHGAAALPNAPDPRKALTQLGLDSWTTDQGLPNATVNTVLQSHDGYVWMGTYDGLARFDGTRFSVFSQGHGLAGNGIRALCEDPEGGLWIGTNGGGLSRYASRGFTRYSVAEGLPSPIVWALAADRRDGSIWIGTNGGGLAHLSRGRIERFPAAESGHTVSSIVQTSDGTIWLAAHAEGLRRLGTDGRFTAYTQADGLPAGLVVCLAPGRGGSIWGATSAGGVFQVDGNRVLPPPPGLEPIRGTAISSLLEDEAGSIWIGTNGLGLARLAGGRLSYLRAPEGLGDVVYALRMDQGGNLWVGTNGSGVSRLRGGSFTTYGSREGLSRDFAYTSFQDGSGTLWVGTAGGLDRLDGGRFVPATPPGERAVMIRSVTEGRDGALWVASYGSGVFRLAGGRWSKFTTREGLPSDSVRAVLVDRAGRVWAATIAGVACLEGGRWKAYGLGDGLPRLSAIGLAEDGEGNLWAGTDGGGVARFRGGRFEPFTSSHGLASDLVLALFVDSTGTLWVGTNGGLSCLRGDRFVSFTRDAGLPSDAVTQICEDGLGHLWIGTSRGVSRIDRSSMEGNGPPWRLSVESFDRLDGMKSSQCTAPGQPAGFRSRDGRLWFATTRGVAVVDPAHLTVDSRPPALVIEEALVNGVPVPFEEGIVLPSGPVRLQVRYAALSPLGPARTSVRFRLEGFDPDWVAGGELRQVDYTRIPPGRYLFRVAGRTGNGRWGEPGATLRVRVEPRLHQTPGFAVAALLALAALVATGFQLRVRGLRARERQLTTVVEERTRGLLTEKERAETATENLRRLQAATRALSSTIDRRAVIDLILVELQKVVPADIASVQELSGGFLEIIAGIGHAAEHVGRRFDPAWGDRRSCEVLEGKRPVIRESAPYADGPFTEAPPAGARSWLGVPLVFGERVIGMLALNKEEAGFYTPELASLALAFASQAAVAIENARLHGAAQDELAERTRAQASLAASERRFRQLAENIDVAFFVRSLDPPQLLYMSPGYERIWGRPLPVDANGFVDTVHPDDREALGAAVARQVEGYDLEYRILRPDGTLRWVRSRTFPVTDEDGRVRRVAGIAEDVTVRKSVEQMRDDLTHTLVHDLRGPLTSIQASMDVLETSLEGQGGKAFDLVRMARNGATKLLSMVNAILDVAQLEQGALSLVREALDVGELTGEVLVLLRPLAAARGVRLVNQVPPGVPQVLADRVLMGRVLENLVGNSIKFTPAGTGVRVGAAMAPDQPGFVRVHVSDDGPGIPVEVRERLFEKFVTGRQRSRGSGLGLLFCRLAVEAHGGRIGGESGPAGGATFAFTVPRVTTTGPIPVPAQPSSRPDPAPLPLAGP